MKKQLYFMNNEKGFILPTVLLFTVVLFIFITANINIYQNDIEITHIQTDQLIIETLLQMGYAKFQKDFLTLNINETLEVQYTFTDGTVFIEYNKENDEIGNLYFYIITNNNSHFSINKYIHLPLKQ